jgi:TonB family protein
MNSIVELLFSLAMRASVVLVAGYLVTFAMRRASASARRMVWVVAAVCLLALPILSLLLPPIAAGHVWSEPAWKMAGPVSAVVTVSPAAVPSTAKPKQVPPSRVSWIVMVWAAGVLAVLGRLTAGVIRLWWLKRYARPIELDGSVKYLESDRVAMPMTWGVLRPVILLPAGHSAWPLERLRVVLAHELIHVEQRDCLFQLLMQIACAFYWFHPLVWLAAAQFRKERERACDDGVLRLGISGPEYAGHLLELARTLQPGRRPALAVAMAHQSHLESRLVALLDAKVNRKKLSRKVTLLTILAAACLLFPIAAVPGQAQGARGTISGFVYDASGAVIPGVAVLATNLDTNARETAIAGAAGEYSLASIPNGHYTLEVNNPGFKTHRNDVTLHANDSQRFDIIMEVGNITEKVEVIGKKPAGLATRSVVPRRIRVGGNVVAAQLVSKVAPIYPERAQEKGIEGPVLLEAVISTGGDILSLKAVTTADPDLAAAAMAAVQQWHYQPTLLNGQPVEVVTTVIVDFRLKP